MTPALKIAALLALSTAPLASCATTLPTCAFVYAPWAYLSSDEGYWPSELTEHLKHVVPQLNGANLSSSVTLDQLSSYSPDVYLTSKDNITDADEPTEPWFVSRYGKPITSGWSNAPATIIAVQKDNGIVDIFYFHFYSWDSANK
jgi:hypothetical protein